MQTTSNGVLLEMNQKKNYHSDGSLSGAIIQKLAKDLFGVEIGDYQAGAIASRVAGVIGNVVGDQDGGASVDDLEGRRGLMLEFPVLLPVRVDGGSISLNLDDVDLEEEFALCVEDMLSGAIPIKVVTKEGEGEAVFLDPQEIRFGGQQNGSTSRRSNSYGSGSSARGRGRRGG